MSAITDTIFSLLFVNTGFMDPGLKGMRAGVRLSRKSEENIPGENML